MIGFNPRASEVALVTATRLRLSETLSELALSLRLVGLPAGQVEAILVEVCSQEICSALTLLPYVSG